MRFHETFNNIHKGVLRSTRQLMQYNLADEPAEVVEKFDTWAAAVCDAYNVPPVRIELLGREALGGFEGGCTVAENGAIVLTRPSLMWLFHQMRHHLQNHGITQYSNREIDAHGWACSLFYQTDTAMFRRLVFECAIPGLKLEDLVPVVTPSPQPVLDEEQQRIFDEIADAFVADLDPSSELASLMEQIAEQDP